MVLGRGRLSQYKLLHEEKKLRDHLMETVLFSKQALFSLLNLHNTVVIKPAFGPGKIIISRENKRFKISSQQKVVSVHNREEMYEYLKQYELTQKYYVVQPLKFTTPLSQIPYRYFVTVHRQNSSSKWRTVSVTNTKNSSIFIKIFQNIFLSKSKSLSVLVAKKLGNSFPSCNTIVVEVLYDYKTGIWIYDSTFHFSMSKWDQYQYLRKSVVPKSDLLTSFTFKDYLTKFSEVIIKPCNGQNGIGIVQIKRKGPQVYEIHSGIRTDIKTNLDEAYRYMEDTYLTKKDYIIQQRVPLATIDYCPMDVRVIAQKDESTWKITGKVVKLAGKNFIVTNAAQKVLTLEEAIRDSTILSKCNEPLNTEIDEICLSATQILDGKNIDLNIIGFDVGITNQGDIWIIEGNYVPDLGMFKEYEEQYKNIKKLNNKK
ncbi:YheC/YheD family protein [Psychrobacillus antarcticus]|uniref:YheC/YheD family protein n=1 Tax=Psychrobacillus antarcticus TaxID=2879115 RepID=UPI002407C7B7|nr:YheC/YheD family protein [Psychrobacillus antarcticus]